MPYFNGVAIFGKAVRVRTSDNPRANQAITAPGVNGVASADLGQRGRVSMVRGVLTGKTQGDLLAALTLFRSYLDGKAYTLTDSFGFAWPKVRLTRFEPGEKIGQDAKWGFWVPYEAEFFHHL